MRHQRQHQPVDIHVTFPPTHSQTMDFELESIAEMMQVTDDETTAHVVNYLLHGLGGEHRDEVEKHDDLGRVLVVGAVRTAKLLGQFTPVDLKDTCKVWGAPVRAQIEYALGLALRGERTADEADVRAQADKVYQVGLDKIDAIASNVRDPRNLGELWHRMCNEGHRIDELRVKLRETSPEIDLNSFIAAHAP